MISRKRNRPVAEADINAIETAQTLLIAARNKLQDAGAHKSANYVRGAIKSVQGALNNARAHLFREQRAPDLSDTGPYATAEDHATARALRITVRALRAQRAAEDA